MSPSLGGPGGVGPTQPGAPPVVTNDGGSQTPSSDRETISWGEVNQEYQQRQNAQSSGLLEDVDDTHLTVAVVLLVVAFALSGGSN